MESIVIKGKKIKLDLSIQTGTTGREFQMRRTEQVLNEAPIWSKREAHHWWIHRFVYIDNPAEWFEIKINEMKQDRYFRTNDNLNWRLI